MPASSSNLGDEPDAKRARPNEASSDMSMAFNIVDIIKRLEDDKKTLSQEITDANQMIVDLKKQNRDFQNEINDLREANEKALSGKAHFEGLATNYQADLCAEQAARQQKEKELVDSESLNQELMIKLSVVKQIFELFKSIMPPEPSPRAPEHDFWALNRELEAMEYPEEFEVDMEAASEQQGSEAILQEPMLQEPVLQEPVLHEPIRRARAPRASGIPCPQYESDMRQNWFRYDMDQYVETSDAVYTVLDKNQIFYSPLDTADVPQQVETVPKAAQLVKILSKKATQTQLSKLGTVQKKLQNEQKKQVAAGVIEVVECAVERDMTRDYNTHKEMEAQRRKEFERKD